MSGTLIFRYTAAGFSTLQKAVPLQVAGFHWAVPSTTLDKACMQFPYILPFFLHLSTPFSLFPWKNS